MITKYKEATFQYEEQLHNKPSEIHEKQVKVNETNVFSNAYYQNLARDVELTKAVITKEYHSMPYNNGKLTYVIIDDIKYKVERVQNTKSRTITIQLSELI